MNSQFNKDAILRDIAAQIELNQQDVKLALKDIADPELTEEEREFARTDLIALRAEIADLEIEYDRVALEWSSWDNLDEIF